MASAQAPLFPYFMLPIPAFDARRGYQRFKMPGVGVRFADGKHAQANVWRDRAGSLVTRLSSQGCAYSFAILDTAGKPPPDEQGDDLDKYLMEVLFLWLIDGVDDYPTTDIKKRLATRTL